MGRAAFSCSIPSGPAHDPEQPLAWVFSAIEQAQPAGVRYASSRLGDGVTFVALVELEGGVDNPLPALPAFVEFQEDLKT